MKIALKSFHFLHTFINLKATETMSKLSLSSDFGWNGAIQCDGNVSLVGVKGVAMTQHSTS